MKKITIIKNNEILLSGDFENQVELESWIERRIKANTFGFPERTIPQSECSEIQLFSALELIPEVLDENGEVISPAMARLPAEYQIQVEDISQQVEQQKINAEALAYLASTDFYVIREADSGVPCPADVKLKRQQARERIVK